MQISLGVTTFSFLPWLYPKPTLWSLLGDFCGVEQELGSIHDLGDVFAVMKVMSQVQTLIMGWFPILLG